MTAATLAQGRKKPAETQQSRTARTRGALVASARAIFADVGYHATATNDVVARADVTRGALYHHFADKQALFEAVFLAVLEQLNLAARKEVEDVGGDTWSKFVGGLDAYLQIVARDPAIQRILLIDGPAVLGWRKWQDLQENWLGSGLVETLNMLMDEGLIKRSPAEPLASQIKAALNDAALYIAHSAEPEKARPLQFEALMRLVGGLKP